MKKYIVDDLIIEASEKENKKGNPKSKGKFLTGIIIALVLVTIAILIKDTNDSPTDDNRSLASLEQENIEVALDESSPAAKTKKEIVKNDEKIGSDTKALLDQIVPLEGDDEKKSSELTLASNEAESLLPSAGESLSSPDNNKEILDVSMSDDLLAPESKKDTHGSDETNVAKAEEAPEAKEKTTPPTTEQTTQEAASEASTAGTETIQPTEETKPADTTLSEGIKDALETSSSAVLLPEESKKDTVAQGEATEAAAPKTTEAIRETLSEKQEPEKISDTLSTLGTPDISATKTESKPEPEKAAEKTETKPETKKSATPSGGDSSTYYIQVGVFNMEPTEKFLSKLKNAGLNYIVVKSGKTRRVRVGPYSSLDRANRAISQINKSTGIKGFAVKTGVPKKSEIETTSARKPAVAQAQAKPKKKEKEKEKKREAKKEKSQTTADKKPETKPEEKVTATPKRKVQQKKKPTYVDPLNLFTQKSQYRYYVHVGTFRGNPPASFLKKLRRAGLSYSISKGKTKRSVLVGPYRSYQSAKSAVSKIGRKAGIKGRVVKAKR